MCEYFSSGIASDASTSYIHVGGTYSYLHPIHWHWELKPGWCPPLPHIVSSTWVLHSRVASSSARPPATITNILYEVTPGRRLLLGMDGSSCCQSSPVHVFTMLVIARDVESCPPISTNLPFTATASLLYWGARRENCPCLLIKVIHLH